MNVGTNTDTGNTLLHMLNGAALTIDAGGSFNWQGINNAGSPLTAGTATVEMDSGSSIASTSNAQWSMGGTPGHVFTNNAHNFRS